MGKTLYLECYNGISGDMTVAALLDLGADKELLLEALNSLKISGYTTKITRVKKSGLCACDFDVILDEDNHDHDMEYLYGHDHHHEHENHEHHNGHHHGHDHHHSDMPHEHHHHHEHRGLKEITDIIEGGDLSKGARDLALKIFNILGKAESKAHGTDIENVHFHEVGAIDSIVDIVSVAVCMDNLGITDVIVPELYEGTGHVRCQHGLMPVPVPAVVNIAADAGLKLHITDREGELVTPTGAAIVAATITKDVLPESFRILKVGVGAGKRDYKIPPLLRAMIIE
ncbi:MAG: LarC family nickel insertion protein [Eubacterium sp.]|nr:LarC family nickel insertion protein [Eubacterium sp.]